jgi:hypothetical protein
LAKISDEPCESRRVAVPKAFRASLKDDGRRFSRGENPYQTIRSSAKQTNRTRGSKSCLSHSSDFQGLTTSRGDEFSARGGRRRRGAAISTVRIPCPRGCSSAGRAPALQAGGQRFEPAHLHQHIDNRIGLSRSSVMRVQQNWILFLFVEFDVTWLFLSD